MLTPLAKVAIAFAVLSLVFFIIGVMGLRKRRLKGVAVGVTGGLLLLSLSALCATISIGTQGYRALTQEEVAAVVRVVPRSHQHFDARFRFADGREETFALAGDELYVDAHILKWKPIANLLGLHTGYELDRVAGRYVDLQDERSNERTIFGLAQEKPVDMFNLRRRYALFTPLLDAEYGSATFVPASGPSILELRVTTSGLLIRRVGQISR